MAAGADLRFFSLEGGFFFLLEVNTLLILLDVIDVYYRGEDHLSDAHLFLFLFLVSLTDFVFAQRLWWLRLFILWCSLHHHTFRRKLHVY